MKENNRDNMKSNNNVKSYHLVYEKNGIINIIPIHGNKALPPKTLKSIKSKINLAESINKIKNITLTYKITQYPDNKGIDIECIDWKDIVTCCFANNDILKYAIDCSVIYLEEYVKGTLHSMQMPKIKPHKLLKSDEFQITYDLKTFTPIDIKFLKNSVLAHV